MSEALEKDIVLKQGEYCFLLDRSKGVVQTITGSTKISMSQTDSLCTWSDESKRFVEASPRDAIKTFVTAPENFYVVLYNPVKNNPDEHPKIGISNITPELDIGRKVIIRGNTSFALYPGQFAKVIQGHFLKTNQYLLVKVYDAKALDEKDKYNGQMFIVKGSETAFFMPKTGEEVVPDENGNFVRDAVVLNDLEYCILVSEDGKKRYIHDAQIVFPEVGSEFVINEETGEKTFRAIELNDLSGIYCKVVHSFDEVVPGDGTIEEIDESVTVDGETEEDTIVRKIDNPAQLIHHEIGEELFITGKDTKIFYPNENLSIITYGSSNKVTNHAIAIPEGEGRYVLNRVDGSIRTVRGSKLFLPDPRYEVIVKRKLSKKECELWYPGNKEVLKYNCPEEENKISFSSIEASNLKALNNVSFATTDCFVPSSITSAVDTLQNGFYGQGPVATDKKSGINRGNTYTKPRTISLDSSKYDGVVTIDVWTGYAVSVVSKSGNRRLIIGPKSSNILDYDETLEVVDNTVYLKYENNRISDVISVQTKDYVCVDVELVYNVNFELSHKDKWFSIENYKQYLIDTTRSIIKKEAKQYTIEEFYASAADIIKKAIISAESDPKSKKLIVFSNGMYVSDVEILSVDITDSAVSELLHKHQQEIVEKTLKLSSTNKEMNVITELAKLEREKVDIQYKNKLYELELNSKLKQEEQKSADEYRKLVEATKKAEKEHEKEMQTLKANIEKIELAATKEKATQELNLRKEAEKLAIEREKARTDALKKTFESVSPDLISAIQSASEHETLRSVSENLAPWALASASNESVSDVINKILRGTSLEGLIDKVVDTKKND